MQVIKKKEVREVMSALTLLKSEQGLKVVAGERYLKLTETDQTNYTSERARRGQFLPKGFRNVTSLEPIL